MAPGYTRTLDLHHRSKAYSDFDEEGNSNPQKYHAWMENTESLRERHMLIVILTNLTWTRSRRSAGSRRGLG
jgi:hypothetical protein